MPIYAILSWLGFIFYGSTGRYVLPVSFVGWLWALINVIRTKRLDLGIVTFFFVLLASLYERHYGFSKGVKVALCISSVFVAMNYSIVIAFWNDKQNDLAKSKSQLWMNTFWGYCLVMMIFWVCAAGRTYLRGENGYTAVGLWLHLHVPIWCWRVSLIIHCTDQWDCLFFFTLFSLCTLEGAKLNRGWSAVTGNHEYWRKGRRRNWE